MTIGYVLTKLWAFLSWLRFPYQLVHHTLCLSWFRFPTQLSLPDVSSLEC